MTKRDNLNELRVLAETSENRERLIAFIDHELELLDKRNAAAAKSAKRGNKAQDELAALIAESLTIEPQTIPEILEKINDENATPSKISYRLSKMVEAGGAIREMVMMKEEGKTARRTTTYRLPESD